ncbi:glutamate-cysteine ligase family protein [Micromonospora sp. NBC_01813]|uniref:glutamate-cysteine ligase family protein n=1 Tax=Micromonospora sp. NBC_01813 TaxID=2975988 RepID=UPI002DD829FF|nr:glutamate-cysteine ligase family protein [Micromonospora sp. NBC_01813]WSA09198.1 glutamate-cysteine ligase family protein [Micromonospora sp. NBC_01813]
MPHILPPDARSAGPPQQVDPDAGDTTDGAIADLAAATGYIGRICFKTGPPRRIGIELEWTVHHLDQPARQLAPDELADALGEHAPPTIRPGSPQRPLPHGGLVTVEPGGQLEISSQPAESLATLQLRTAAETRFLVDRLARAGLRLGGHGCDPHRRPHQILTTRRYAAMAAAFARQGPTGATMMCGTAGIQVCLDAGTPAQLPLRWAAAHALGPVLVALFANSPRSSGRDTGWASSRMRTWLTLDPDRTAPPAGVTDPAGPADPVAAWAQRVLATPPLFVVDGSNGWRLPDRAGFGEWIRSGVPRPPTYADLDLHLSTLFPPVRPRGYLEIRYLDTQPGDEWILPLATLSALFARDETLRTAMAYTAEAADRWLPAARAGLADPVIAAAAGPLVALVCDRLTDTDLPAGTARHVARALHARLRDIRA